MTTQPVPIRLCNTMAPLPSPSFRGRSTRTNAVDAINDRLTLTPAAGVSVIVQLKQDFSANGTVPVLAEQVSAAPREKVIRVALAALRNLCYGRLDVLNSEMISCGLPKTLENLLERKWCVDDHGQQVLDELGAEAAGGGGCAGRTRRSSRTWSTCMRHCRTTPGSSGTTKSQLALPPRSLTWGGVGHATRVTQHVRAVRGGGELGPAAVGHRAHGQVLAGERPRARGQRLQGPQVSMAPRLEAGDWRS